MLSCVQQLNIIIYKFVIYRYKYNIIDITINQINPNNMPFMEECKCNKIILIKI